MITVVLRCKKCGSRVRSHWKFCPNCGEKIAAISRHKEQCDKK